MPNKTITDHSETIIGIHLDFKYLMPNKKYLLAWIRRLPEMGINTLWIEYEDKFPYRQYPFIQVRDGLTPDEVRALVDTAHEVGLRVIPTVQSLSHLEFALGRPELAHLREREDIPTQICPCNPAAITLLQNLIDDILSYHEADDWIHLGADEAWALGTCPKCAARAGDDVLAFRLEHTRMICEYVRRKGKRPLISDDMFWGVPERSAELPKDVILGAWNYGATRFDSTGNLARQVAEKLKKIPDFPALITKLDDVLNTYPASTARLQGLAAAAKQHQDEAKLLAALAELKLVSARIFDLSVRGRGNRAALQEALAACGRALRLRLAKFYEKASVERWLRMMWQPQMTMLNETE